MGTTLFKDAKTPDDYAQVESEFKQAVDLAPQWPDARYNLALAKEAAGDYAGAMEDLKLYQQFKLSDEDARKVQDKIYSLEARAEKAKVAANAKEAAAREEEAKYGWMLGRWSYVMDGTGWDADGIMLAKREGNQVEFKIVQGTGHTDGRDYPISADMTANVYIRATFSPSGDITWEGRSDEAGSRCPSGWSSINPVVGNNQRTIKFVQQRRMTGRCTPTGQDQFTLTHE
jgi:hypothetical protein